MRKFFEYRIFLKYLFMYLCIVAAFILLLIPIYTTVYQVVKNNTVQNEADKVWENVYVLDSKIEKLTTISTHIQNDSDFLKLNNITGEPQNSEYVYLAQAQQTLNDLRQQYDIDLFAYVIFRNNEIFISESKVAPDYKSIYDTYLKYEKITEENIRDYAFHTGMDMLFLPVQRIVYVNGETINGLTCIVKGATKGYGANDYAVVFTIDVNDFAGSVASEQIGDEFLQITDNRGTLLLNQGDIESALQIEGTAIQDYQINGNSDTYTLIPARTEYGDLSIIKGIRATVFERMIVSVLRIIQIYIVIAIILALMLSLLLSFRQFSGIRKVLELIRTRPNAWKGRNEYKYIYSSVKDLSEENKKYESDIIEIKASMKNRLIEKMFLQGIYTEKETAELERYTGTKIEFFVVISLNFVQETEEELSEQEYAEQYGKIIFYIKNAISKENLQTISMNYGFGEVITLVMLQADDSAGCEKIYSIMRNLAFEIIAVFGQPVEIGISSIGAGIRNVHACYLQSKRAARQIGNPYESPVGILSSQQEELNILEDIDIDQQLFDIIMAGESDSIQRLFERIYRHIKKYTFSSEQEIMQVFFAIRNPIANASKRLNKYKTEALPAYNDNDTVLQLLENLEQSALALSEQRRQSKNNRMSSVKGAVIEYLNEHYTDPNLCVANVAEKFSLSEKYIFKIVKEDTGLPFGKYVETIRMQKAEKLLRDTEISAAEISVMVGFQSITTFYKAFKRIYGVAPVAWRESKD